jgi:flagella basal body P-ring formation protein FlgA
MTALPVLGRPVAFDETITASDIVIERQRADRIGTDVLTEARELVGKTPRHALRAHEPVRAGDVQVPLLVHKGDLVTIVLETRDMRLTAQGKALDDGARGAVIRVANTASSRVIEAAVAGVNVVTVTPPSEIAVR